MRPTHCTACPVHCPRNCNSDLVPMITRGETQIYVVVLSPNEGHYYHWMIAARLTSSTDINESRWRVIEAIRSNDDRKFYIRKDDRDPREQPEYKTPLVFVARAAPENRDKTIASFFAVEANRVDPQWDSQNFVDEVLRELVKNECIPEWKRSNAWDILAPYHGRMEVAFEDLPRPEGRPRVLSPEVVEDSDSSDEKSETRSDMSEGAARTRLICEAGGLLRYEREGR